MATYGEIWSTSKTGPPAQSPLHKDVLVKFEVEGFEHEVKCTIGVKQGTRALHHLHGWCYDRVEETIYCNSTDMEMEKTNNGETTVYCPFDYLA